MAARARTVRRQWVLGMVASLALRAFVGNAPLVRAAPATEFGDDLIACPWLAVANLDNPAESP